MFNITIQHRRPVRRCRRNKISGGPSPSDESTCLGNLLLNAFCAPGYSINNATGLLDIFISYLFNFFYFLTTFLKFTWNLVKNTILSNGFVYFLVFILCTRCVVCLPSFSSEPLIIRADISVDSLSAPLLFLYNEPLKKNKKTTEQKAEKFSKFLKGNSHNVNKLSYRKGEIDTGIDHCTLYQWDKRHKEIISLLMTRMPNNNRLNKQDFTDIGMFFSSPSGRAVLDLLFYSATKNFIVTGRAGSNTVSKFFKDCCLDLFFPCSERYLRDYASKISDQIIEFEKEEIKRLMIEKKETVVALAPDETWNGGKMILAAVDIISNYTFVEQISTHRTAEAWMNSIKAKATELNVKIISQVTDEGPGLVSAGSQMLLPRFPDIFHIDNEIFQGFMIFLGRSINQSEKIFNESIKMIELAEREKIEDDKMINMSRGPGRPVNWDTRIDNAMKYSLEKQSELLSIIDLKRTMIESIHKMNDHYHLVNLKTGQIQTSGTKIVELMVSEIEKVKSLALNVPISEDKINIHFDKAIRAIKNIQPAHDKIIKQSKDKLNNFNLSKKEEDVFWNSIVPAQYCLIESKKSRVKARSRRKLIKFVDEKMDYAKDELDSNTINQLLDLSIELCHSFQRSSSATEGVNGSMARTFWTQRGYGIKAQQAIRILRDFDRFDGDGRSNAEKFFQQKPISIDKYILAKLPSVPMAHILDGNFSRRPWPEARFKNQA